MRLVYFNFCNFNLSQRRYTGSKTKLLESIDEALLKHFDYKGCENLSFFDVFAGTGVVSEYFIQKKEFSHLIINDFLESNFVIYKGFFAKESFDTTKLESYTKAFNELNLPLNSKKYSHKTIEKDFHTSLASPTNLEALQDNYYSLNFGNSFFSLRDSKKIGFIREELDNLLESKKITKQEFTILLTSLLYSVDRIANTVGHYDAYRKNVRLQDRFIFMLIKPLTLQDKNVEIYKKDSNILAKEFLECKNIIDIAFLDPPYNSRQYSRFYHLLETLTLNHKPTLYGIAKKPEATNMSEYCKVNAKIALKDLLDSLKHYTRYIVMTYNNTNSANARSNTRISLNELKILLETIGKTSIHEYHFKAFNSGKTDTNTSFKEHKEYVFVCEV